MEKGETEEERKNLADVLGILMWTVWLYGKSQKYAGLEEVFMEGTACVQVSRTHALD